mmetsp:Transcript_30186/g.89587  ORF Transcript_30186/g.89587 Transcript_30186/m.89587 type:complete len:419 (+) Transcript_30186:2981-4237(+)
MARRSPSLQLTMARGSGGSSVAPILSVNIENAAFVLSKTLFAASLARLAALVMLCETLPMALPASLPFSPRVAMLDPIDRVARSFRALPVFGSDCRLSPAPVELVLVRPNSSVGMRVVGALTALPLLLRSLTSLVASTSPSAAVSAASLTLHACRRSMLLPELHGEPLQLSAPPGKFIADGDHDLSMLLPVLRAPRSRIACVRPGADSGDEHSWMVWRLWAFGTSSDGGGGGGTSTWELLAGAVCSGGAAPGCAAWPAAVADPLCKSARLLLPARLLPPTMLPPAKLLPMVLLPPASLLLLLLASACRFVGIIRVLLSAAMALPAPLLLPLPVRLPAPPPHAAAASSSRTSAASSFEPDALCASLMSHSTPSRSAAASVWSCRRRGAVFPPVLPLEPRSLPTPPPPLLLGLSLAATPG